MRKLLTNCPNCGGELLIDGVCPYCGTKVRYANELDIDRNKNSIELILRIKKGNELLILPTCGIIEELSINYSNYDGFYCDGTLVKTIGHTEIDFSFHGVICDDLGGVNK